MQSQMLSQEGGKGSLETEEEPRRQRPGPRSHKPRNASSSLSLRCVRWFLSYYFCSVFERFCWFCFVCMFLCFCFCFNAIGGRIPENADTIFVHSSEPCWRSKLLLVLHVILSHDFTHFSISRVRTTPMICWIASGVTDYSSAASKTAQ